MNHYLSKKREGERKLRAETSKSVRVHGRKEINGERKISGKEKVINYNQSNL